MAHRFHPQPEIDNDLRHINDELRIEAYDHRPFVPKLALREYLTRERVKKLLLISCTHSLRWEEVRNKYLAVFVILLSIEQETYIANFLQHNYLADTHLPFHDPSAWPEQCRKFFKDFDQIQWQYCAQSLEPDDLHDKVLDPRIVVPLISQHVFKSGDSKTSKVEVQPDYNCLLPSSQRNTDVTAPQYFVLKTSNLRYENLHKNEVRAYTILRHQDDISDNIVRFHGSWMQGDTCNILLEYVEGGTLEDLFLSNRPTAFDMLSFWTRLLDILKPVCRIHCQGDYKSYDMVEHGVHQDIKPQNILVARDPSAATFFGTFKLADLGLTYLPAAEANQREERSGRDVPGTQMYSAPECFRPEAELFTMKTVRPVDCKKDVWSLACVLSEAAVWCVLGPAGLTDYRDERRAQTTGLPEIHHTAYSGCFHDGQKVLSAVEIFHDAVRASRGVNDQIINDILSTIEEMFEYVGQRPDAMSALRRFEKALETARRISYRHPKPFQVSPELPHSLNGSPARPGDVRGLGLKQASTQQGHVQIRRRPIKSTSTISQSSTSKASNCFYNTPMDTIHPSNLAKQGWYATVSQVSHWLQNKRSSSLSSSRCPVSEEKLACLDGTDQIFIIDNSASMQPHRQRVEETFAALSYIVKHFDRDGMDLYFTTSRVTDHAHHRTSMITKLSKVEYRGETQMDITLSKVLGSRNSKLRAISALLKSDNNWAKSIYVFTDGKWHGEDDSLCGIPALIESVTRKISLRGTLGIQFIQFGNDEVGTRRLKELDDGLQKLGIMYVCLPKRGSTFTNSKARDIIDTEPHDGNVYKMLLGPRSETWDKVSTTRS
ncbi:hypothetical protein BKA63DRAFT_428685 [Paraphoma chrysanthemicola]|nr:hypothetical protein BKA63DRAFT_428685 [Paraphoma chrysanthemicola]